MMNRKQLQRLLTMALLVLVVGAFPVGAEIVVQCPGDTNGDAIIDTPDPLHPNAKCMHIAAGDGFIKMADGVPMYTFGFSNVTGITPSQVMTVGMLNASFPAPTIELREGDEFYLTLTNVGMKMRPDLFDPHSVHWHGFPNAAPIFDGIPEASVTIDMASSLTYYYKVANPGTFFYHCHVEATEHIQMGMSGNLYVHPAQDGTPITYQGREYSKFVYNDGDGSTGFDVEYPIQITGFDSNFHDASVQIQPLLFSELKDNYAMFNGRGYPDTVVPGTLNLNMGGPPEEPCMLMENMNKCSQYVSSAISATKGQRILLRLWNISLTRPYTVRALGLPMEVIGASTKILRSSTGQNLFYKTNALDIGAGEAYEVILDTKDVPKGTYFLYTTNLNYLSNKDEDFGGMMTEIVVN